MSGILHLATMTGDAVAVVLVLLGALPVLVGTYQIALAALHGLRNHYGQCRPFFPRTAIIIPAWNEGTVVSASIDRLMRLEYPRDALRVYVVDDASTDDTPDIVRTKEREYPGRVIHLRREAGGQGKAHTLNHGLAIVLAQPWLQALLIMDADVIYSPSSLRKMTRHLADPRVGAVTAYIKEGSRPGNAITRFIGFEYIAAQAAARRGQNVLGVIACLAGGAQLHSRENLEALGGRIDTTSLAEDTFTTFNTQLGGRRVVFEPHATVLAEEPGSVSALWKQRVRWARGNYQVTSRYRHVWFRPLADRREHRGGLGGVSFGLIWFSLFLQPFFMLGASAGLLVLFFTNRPLASTAFHSLWIITALTFVFITTLTVMLDPATGRHCWREAILFPGLVSLVLIVYAVFPGWVRGVVSQLAGLVGVRITPWEVGMMFLFIYVWPTLSMVAALLAKSLEPRPGGRWLSPLLVYLIGYGPLLCTMSLAAYLKELRGADMTWEKTMKTGKVTG
jgi:cellulose synthase/poly-beta-1,6-N-acetylglucosamine synthase-like glycosyltransferase